MGVMKLAHYRIFIISVIVTSLLIGVKYILHSFGLEPIVLGTLHGSAISGVIFVIGFILSATIADYKEAERIPAEAAATIEDMHEDILTIQANYPKVDVAAYTTQLEKVTKTLAGDLRNSKSNKAKTQLQELMRLNAQLETAGVPANFIVKLKQQQASLVRHLFRVNYIQRISFIPSASILVWAIVILAIVLMMITAIEPFLGGMLLTGIITFILVYVLQLIQVIKTPFHSEGKTKDDVSVFLLERTLDHIRSHKK